MPTQLPAHLQNRNVPDINSRALAGIGGSMPPHISIRGNQFTLVDAAGNEQPIGATMQACIVDISDVICKKYFENDWTPGSDEPPTCWSTNGVAPSRDAITPQSRTCAECQWNVRGSDTSKLSGKPIKACRDEKLLALLLPTYTDMVFQFVLTPGAFKNWGSYLKQFEQHQVSICDVLTVFSFENKKSGVLEFKPSEQVWIDAATADARDKALNAKVTDALVGRLDQPIQAALAPPVGEQLARVLADPQSQQPAPATGPFGGAPSAGFPSTATAPAQTQTAPLAPAASLSEAPKGRGRPRKAAAQAEPEVIPPQPASGGFQPAPFRPNPAPQGAQGSPFGAPQGNGAAPFGIAPGASPTANPELAAALAKAGFGGKQA